MTAKTVIPRVQVSADVDSAIDHYLAEGPSDAALGFMDALEQAYAHLSRNVATGSPAMGMNWVCLACALGR